MKKWIGCILFCMVICCTFYLMSVVSDHNTLTNALIRMHVIANSDDPQDQAVKLKVRDAICESIESDLSRIHDLDLARAYLIENIPKLEKLAKQVLISVGMDPEVTVSLEDSYFPTRFYETFRLPAGIYEALKITIGDGEGKNWWCVAFPSLCLYATEDEFQAAAVSAGFSENLSNSMVPKSGCEIRFFIMDFLGKLQRR